MGSLCFSKVFFKDENFSRCCVVRFEFSKVMLTSFFHFMPSAMAQLLIWYFSRAALVGQLFKNDQNIINQPGHDLHCS